MKPKPRFVTVAQVLRANAAMLVTLAEELEKGFLRKGGLLEFVPPLEVMLEMSLERARVKKRQTK